MGRPNNPQILTKIREAVLRSTRTIYMELFEEGLLQRTSREAVALLASVDEALMEAEDSLIDWRILSRGLSASDKQRSIYTSLVYIHAREKALKSVCSQFGDDDDVDTPEEKTVVEESSATVKAAKELLRSMPEEIVTAVRSQMLA